MLTPHHHVDTFDQSTGCVLLQSRYTEAKGRSVTVQVCDERIKAERFLTTSTVLKTWQ